MNANSRHLHHRLAHGDDCPLCENEAEQRVEPPPSDDLAADGEAANDWFDRDRW